MKKLTHSAAARAAAFILCLLCGLTALLCAAGYFMTRIDRDRTLPEPDSVSVYKTASAFCSTTRCRRNGIPANTPSCPPATPM